MYKKKAVPAPKENSASSTQINSQVTTNESAQKSLPHTGSQKNGFIPVIGLAIMGITSALIGIRRKKTK